MADIRLTTRVRFANGQDAAFLDVEVGEPGRTYSGLKTSAIGAVDTVLRPQRKMRIFSFFYDDPTDRPNLIVVISDLDGHSFETPAMPLIVLPPAFNPPPDEAATVPAPPAGSPSAIADGAVRSLVSPKAPGHVFLIRRNGAVWADATRGLARRRGPGTSARAMTNDTIVHLASMSKPITSTALVAMIEDWTAIRDAVAGIGKPGAPTLRLRLVTRTAFFWETSREFDVPTVLAPLFSNRSVASSFLNPALPPSISPSVRTALAFFIAGWRVASTLPPVPPGHLGLLRRVLDGIPVPGYDDPFLPLIRARLGGASARIGANVDTLTIADLITHHTDLLARIPNPDPAFFTPAEIAALQEPQPDGRLATANYWNWVKLLLAEPANRRPTDQYGNNNYIVLTTIIEACTGTTFNDYLIGRLFSDNRFRLVRRRVVEPRQQALYYSGTAPDFAGGRRFSDYSNFAGHGGFYTTANQFTDWLHALCTGQPVARVGSTAPLIGAAGLSKLFGTTGYFSLGISNRGGPAVSATRYQHNGGTGNDSGRVNGNVAVIVSPAGHVYTVLFVANGDIPADPPLDAAILALPWT